MKLRRTIKKITFASFLIFSLFLNSCENEKQINTHLIKEIKNRGKLVAITGYNNYSYFIYKGKTLGFEYELLKKFADKLGVEVEIKLQNNIDEMFANLEKNNGDLIAYNLTITQERKKNFNFTNHINTTHQVLIQRKPKKWRRLSIDRINDSLVKTPYELENKTVYVRNGSAYINRLKNLAEENGININVVIANDTLSTEDLIDQVANRKIDFTIADENIANLNKEFYSILDIDTKISLPQRIAWAVNKNSNELLEEFNKWIDDFKKTMEFQVIYERYYEHKSYYKNRRQSKFLLKEGGVISQYDHLIKKYAKNINWDWRLLASLIYQESKFVNEDTSWAGAIGLMQILPETGASYGVDDLLDPEKNIQVGAKYLKWLDDYWAKKIKNKDERVKFVLASYNLGYGHINDALKLAKKYGADSTKWDMNVESYLKKKSSEKFYNDEVVRNGYCKCDETINFVKEIMKRYERYTQFLK
ncbi:MAG: transporter substrate-binding domain-containing protein [Ignavibacteriae bacterium]|nr:transporter substrate-binding domain-containing protein [Ignavibacteriota bacterium]